MNNIYNIMADNKNRAIRMIKRMQSYHFECSPTLDNQTIKIYSDLFDRGETEASIMYDFEIVVYAYENVKDDY